MRGAVLNGPRDVRLEERDASKIIEPTDAILRLPAEGYRAMDERRAIKTLLRHRAEPSVIPGRESERRLEDHHSRGALP